MSLRMIESIKRLRVTPTQKLVLFCLADCHNGETGRCDPSYAHIMQITGLSNRAVATALQALREVRVLQFDSRNGWRTSYQITPQGMEGGIPAVTEATACSGDECASPPPVSVVHSHVRATCEPAAATGERGSLLPVNVLHSQGSASCKPAARSCERGSRPPVKEAHINRKVSEETGSTGGRPPRTDSVFEVDTSAAALPQNLKPRREDWRDWHRQQARRANAVSAPLLAPPEFAESWTRYRDYRTRRATEARISSEAVAWTLDAAEAALRLCERHAATHGWSAVAAQVDAAIHARWQGLHFQASNPQSSKAYANSRPTPARSDSANAPGRYA